MPDKPIFLNFIYIKKGKGAIYMKFPKLFGNKQKKTEFSKKVTVASVILAYLFVIFVCYEIHIQ
jgi:hypothetical protein